MSSPQHRLRSLRLARGVTIQGLARAASVSRQTIYDVESGARQPDISTLRKLATALGVTVADLLEDESKEAV
jgi:transcriptional regulator with XRE-family HTH domain